MHAVVLADPAFEAERGFSERIAMPALLILGWSLLFAFGAAYLLEEMPLRSSPIEVDETAPAVPHATTPVQVIVVEAPEPPKVVAAPAVEPPAPLTLEAPPVVPAPVAVGPDYVGTWGPTPIACGARARRRGYIPATITAGRAKAGDTVCTFRDARHSNTVWTMTADCADRDQRWSSQIQMFVDGDRMTWSSAKGTSSYVRCKG